MSLLIKTLNECPDYSDELFINLPYIKEILNGEFIKNLELHSFDKICQSFLTFSYLCYDASHIKPLINEFLWRIGESEELFCEYFDNVSDEFDYMDNNVFEVKGFMSYDGIKRIILLELSKAYPKVYESAELMCRYLKHEWTTYKVIEYCDLRMAKYYFTKRLILDLHNGLYKSCIVNLIEMKKNDVAKFLISMRPITQEYSCALACALVCALASKHGNLDMLKFMREHGYPWDYRTTEYAIAWGHLDVLKWALSQGCEFRKDHYGHWHIVNDEIIEWLKSNSYL